MNTAARLPLVENGDIAGGVIKARENDCYWVETDAGLKRAHKAFGCLVEPRVADEVLVSILPNQGVHILSVLERQNDESADICFKPRCSDPRAQRDHGIRRHSSEHCFTHSERSNRQGRLCGGSDPHPGAGPQHCQHICFYHGPAPGRKAEPVL